tara:strand:- start:594 stop:848 length:255 start_codon:yes stop_codon:yes gene_type:complete
MKITRQQLRKIIQEQGFTKVDAVSDSGGFDEVFYAADLPKLIQATDGYFEEAEIKAIKDFIYKIVKEGFPDEELIDVYENLGGR